MKSQTTVTKVIQIDEGSYTIVDVGNAIASAIASAFRTSSFTVTSTYVKRTDKSSVQALLRGSRGFSQTLKLKRKAIANPSAL